MSGKYCKKKSEISFKEQMNLKVISFNMDNNNKDIKIIDTWSFGRLVGLLVAMTIYYY